MAQNEGGNGLRRVRPPSERIFKKSGLSQFKNTMNSPVDIDADENETLTEAVKNVTDSVGLKSSVKSGGIDEEVFNYDSSHAVDEVSSGDYTTCTVRNSIASYNSGTTTIALNTTGKHYFICGVVGHCSGGMKLTVAVTGGGDGSPSAAPSSITADSPSTTPLGNTLTPATRAGTSNIPAESSSSAISPFVAAVFSFVALMSELVLA